jgi:5-methylcytosine-specific restriction endonuclease McrA
MNTIPAWLRRQVVFRAGGRCEYCGLAQEGQEATFHVDHIVPRAAGGPTEADNLALACVSCLLRRLRSQVGCLNARLAAVSGSPRHIKGVP